ncbi:ABC transporter substrate-binding protein [Lacrimispora sp.]|uniref:ABC transporter substrate-binding protein n=1 Tax=Lacrimispora sp. TaxID=2719234 RepID=UPI00289CCF4D|nr:ABC transporter substrate-binding protein [Lacrimispora sp.]
MKKSRQWTMVILAAILLAGMTAGCGNSSSSTEGGKETQAAASNQSAGSETSAAGGEANPEKPVDGAALKDDIVMGMLSKHTTVDEMEASNTQHNYVWRMVLDTLTHYNNETGELEPQLASEWSTEDGGKTYTFKLREGVKFHNGEILKASDVVFTFNRMKGTTACNGLFEKVESVEAVDESTVKMTLSDANLDWPYMMTLPTASIMNEKACSDDPTEGPAVGTGPWKLDSYEFGNYTKLAAFDESWRGAPNAKTFTFKYIPDDSARLIALQNGEIDICQDPSNIELSAVTGDPKLDLISYKGGSLTYLAFNTQKAPADNADLRKAVAYGIDLDSIIIAAAEGYGTKATSFWGWDEYGYYDCGGYTRDVEKAKEYVKKAYPNGAATLEISVSGSVRKTIAEMMQSQLKEVGIDVTINEMDSAGISTSTTNGEHQACIYGMGFNVFGDDTRRILQPGSAVNKAHYDSKEVMNLLDEAVAETDETKRKEDYQKIQENIYENVPYIPIYFADGFIAAKKGTGGIDIYPTSHHDFSGTFVPAE